MKGLIGILLALIFMMGASIYSFLNVVAYRLPKEQSFISGRSYCPACGHTLGALDLIPLVSILLLRARCRYCQAKIPLRDTAIELLGGALALLCVWKWGITPQAAMIFAVSGVLTVIGLIDQDTMEIPNGLVLILAALSLLASFLWPDIEWISRAIGVISISAPLLLITLLIPGAFGGGDIKLMAAAGWLLGWQLSLAAFFAALITGGAYGIFVLATRRLGRKDHFAFGPYLCCGIFASLLWGQPLLSWYVGLLH